MNRDEIGKLEIRRKSWIQLVVRGEFGRTREEHPMMEDIVAADDERNGYRTSLFSLDSSPPVRFNDTEWDMGKGKRMMAGMAGRN
jgi:hypothetical protein